MYKSNLISETLKYKISICLKSQYYYYFLPPTAQLLYMAAVKTK